MDVVLAMPAFMPFPALPERIRGLRAEMDVPVVVVDDGSGAEFRAIFDEVASMQGCTVLRHEANMGKGAALKTAFAFIAKGFPRCIGIVTVDSDGQHAPEDCRRLAQAVVKEPRALHLGARRFSFRSTPFRSWWGNRWTSLLFGLLFNRWLQDTQTGLRAFSRADMPFFLSIPGDGYEYEMAALAHAAKAGMELRSILIRTIYTADNGSSHFRPLLDTFRIYRALLRSFLGVSKKKSYLPLALIAAAIAAIAAVAWLSGGEMQVPCASEQMTTQQSDCCPRSAKQV